MPESTSQKSYVCPGARYAISREVHLGRLASGYELCRSCPKREDRSPLTKRTTDRLDWLWQREVPSSGFFREGWRGHCLDARQTTEIRQVAASFGLLCRNRLSSNKRATVLIAGDGHGDQLEWLAAAQEGLRFVGVDAIDLGPATAAAMALAVLRLEAGAGLLVSSERADRFRVTMRFWGADGHTWSSAGRLDELQEIASRPVDRPCRTYGEVRRHTIADEYLAHIETDTVREKKLRIALASNCGATSDWVVQLSQSYGIEVVDAMQDIGTEDQREDTSGKSLTAYEFTDAALLERLRARVLAGNCQLGARIWNQGESLQLIDELGAPIDGATVVAMLVGARRQGTIAARVAVAEDIDPKHIAEIENPGGQVLRAGSTCESFSETVWRQNTLYGVDAEDRIWFRQPHGAADALRALGNVVALMHSKGQSLSELRRDVLEPSPRSTYDSTSTNGTRSRLAS